MKKLKLLSLFSGIGAFEEALENMNIPYELVNYCEFNPMVATAYSIVREEDKSKNLGDITQVNEKEIEDFDLMTYGFPCQDISALGNMQGCFDEDGNLTRSGLFYEAIRIAKEKQPKYMIAENVKALTYSKHKEDFEGMINTLNFIGYNTYYKVLNAKDFGLPQSRPRIFLISIRKDIDKGFNFPNAIELTTKASDCYDKDFVGEEYYVNEHQKEKYINEFRIKKQYSSLNADIIICQTTKQGRLSNPQNFVKDEYGYRIMTPMEHFALQGFKKEQAKRCLESGLTKEELGYVAGNSIAVPVLENIYQEMYKQYWKLELEDEFKIN